MGGTLACKEGGRNTYKFWAGTLRGDHGPTRETIKLKLNLQS